MPSGSLLHPKQPIVEHAPYSVPFSIFILIGELE